MMETPDLLIKIIKEMPQWMEDEKALLQLVHDSWQNHLTMAYNNQGNKKFDCEKFEKITRILNEQR